MSSAARKLATYADILALPEHVVGELINGELHTMPRPRPKHARASSTLGVVLGAPFNFGSGGPGGWIILDEPEVHIGQDVLVPDIGGWRRERLPDVPQEAWFSLMPDWVCEVLSPPTAQYDRSEKMPLYAQWKVPHLWLIDPDVKTLEVFKLDGATYRLLKTWRESELVRAEPFELFELQLGLLWQW
jgi:Uma2 family endonuclease